MKDIQISFVQTTDCSLEASVPDDFDINDRATLLDMIDGASSRNIEAYPVMTEITDVAVIV